MFYLLYVDIIIIIIIIIIVIIIFPSMIVSFLRDRHALTAPLSGL
jgi:uncharacterized SAM-binding protein YcdF (DUF218 family)